MMGRYVLPWFGGGPAVWTNCLLFFQILLLVGYAYAHWLGSRPSTRLQASLHMTLLAASLVFLPIAPRVDLWKPSTSADPSGRILLLLAATVGGPYFLLASTGPLLQRWFHMSEPARSPWRLYALSNLGSFAALFSYPFLVEPFVAIAHAGLDLVGILLQLSAGLCGWTAWRVRSVKPEVAVEQESGVRGRRRGRFSSGSRLAMRGSILLLSTTNHRFRQDIAVNPHSTHCSPDCAMDGLADAIGQAEVAVEQERGADAVDGSLLARACNVWLHPSARYNEPDFAGHCGQSFPLGGGAF